VAGGREERGSGGHWGCGLYVAARANHRIQVLDGNGRFLDKWATSDPTHIMLSADQSVWVSDLEMSQLLK
jgi:hypothetical protein